MPGLQLRLLCLDERLERARLRACTSKCSRPRAIWLPRSGLWSPACSLHWHARCAVLLLLLLLGARKLHSLHLLP